MPESVSSWSYTPVRRTMASLVGRLRANSALRWLDRPEAYALGATILTALSAGTALIAPMILSPEAFGAFALLATLFQFAARCDLGLSQMADRDLAVGGDRDGPSGADLLRARWRLGLLGGLLILPAITFLAARPEGLEPLGTAIAVAGGIAAMIAGGPVTLFRAGSRIWEFTASALILQAGMTAPRLIGLILGGTNGCYAVLLAWYGGFAWLIALPKQSGGLPMRRLAAMVASALPLFLFSSTWLAYLFANRWISSALSGPRDFGLFAFGANLAYTAIGTIGAIGQAYYPRLLTRIGAEPAESCSALLRGQSERLILMIALPLVVILPVSGVAVDHLFPHFSDGAMAAAVLAIGCVPACLAAWILPVAIALSRHPLRETMLLFVPATALLAGGMAFFERAFGIEGQAAASGVSALFLVVAIAGLLRRGRILTRRDTFRLVLTLLGLMGGLMIELALVGIRPSFAASAASTASPTSQVTAAAAAPLVLPPDWSLVFGDDFSRLSLAGSDPTGRWEPGYPWGGRTNPDNAELEYYVDPRPEGEPAPLTAFSPFSIGGGALSITARRTPPADRRAVGNKPYLSGLLTTVKSFSMRHGYVEIVARIPQGRGLWPAFWLLPVDGSWPPEIDVMEARGSSVSALVVSVHWREDGRPVHSSLDVPAPDLSAGFNTFGVKWDRDLIEWYLNRSRVAWIAAPPGLDVPMYLLVNLAVGGTWAGNPGPFTRLPASFDIKTIRAYAPPPRPDR